MAKIRLGVIFGSRSVEHEVSIITAVQLMKHVDRSTYDVVPIYVDKKGNWLSGPELEKIESFKNLELVSSHHAYPLLASPGKELSTSLVEQKSVKESLGSIDVALICCHGTMGEDGTIQGLLELAGIPYQGPGVVGSAVGMDKVITKKILEASGVPVVNFQWFTESNWKEDKEAVLNRLLDPKNTGHKLLTFPLFVKPANLGSSVGITKAKDRKSLEEAIEVALSFDRKVIVEQGIENMKEINVSVLGFDDYTASVPEEPVSSGELLSYADKYERGGGKKSGGMASLNRRIPAPISASLTKTLQDAAIMAVRQCDCSGVVRVDMIVKPETGEYWVNELNTIPGSMSFYLWEASGVSYTELIDRLVEIAKKRQASKVSKLSSIQTTIIK